MANQSLLFVRLVFLILILAMVSQPTVADEKDDDSDNGAWVTEVEPGIRRYGKVSKYAEVGPSQSFDVAPDGETIAFGSSTIKFWDIGENKVRDKIENASTNLIEYSADGLRLYTARWNGSGELVSIYNSITGEKELAIKLPKESDVKSEQIFSANADGETQVVQTSFHPHGMAVSPVDEHVAVHDNRNVLLFDAQSGELVSKIKVENYLRKIAFVDDGKKLIDSNGVVYSTEDGSELDKLPKRIFGQYIQTISVNPQNTNQIVASNWSTGLVLYDLENEKRTKLETDTEAKQFLTTTFSGNGKLLAGGTYPVTYPTGKSSKAMIYVWDVETGKIKNKMEMGGGQAAWIRFSSKGDWLYSKGYNEYGLTEWDLSEKEIKADHKGHKSPIFHMRFGHRDESLLTASYQGGAIFFDLEEGKPGTTITGQNTNFIEGNSDGSYYVVAPNYNTFSIFDKESNRTKRVSIPSYQQPSVVSRLSGMITGRRKNQQWENFAISQITMTDDNRHAVVASRGQRNFRYQKFDLKTGKSVERKKFKMADYWDTGDKEEGQPRPNYSQLQWRPYTMSVSKDGQYLAIINEQKKVLVIDSESEEVLHELVSLKDINQSKLHFMGDSRLMVSDQNKLSMWDMDSGEQIGDDLAITNNNGHSKIAISGDESRLAYMSNSKQEVKIIDVDSWKEVFSRRAEEFHNGVALSKDGSMVALAKQNCQFDVWEVDRLSKK